MIPTARVLEALVHDLGIPLQPDRHDPVDPVEWVGPYDRIAPSGRLEFPTWSVVVFHDAKRMLQRYRRGTTIDARGFTWFLDADPYTADDQFIFWHAWKLYGNVELHWLTRGEEGEMTPELLTLDRTLSAL